MPSAYADVFAGCEGQMIAQLRSRVGRPDNRRRAASARRRAASCVRDIWFLRLHVLERR
jgi:hypothetical protein